MKLIKSPTWPALIWLILITVLLCLPGSALPKETWLNQVWIDKVVHIALFGILVTLWCRASSSVTGKKRLFYQIAFYSVAYGIAMEFVQKYFIPNRSLDWRDMLADGAGSAAGLYFSLRTYIKK